MKISKAQLKNVTFLVIIVLLLIPKTRQSIQILLNKGLALIAPSVEKDSNQKMLSETDYLWNLQSTSGALLHFDDLKGKVILVNFWATWCPPCIAEMPSLEALFQDYKNEVAFVFVSNETHETTKTFLNDKNYSFPSFVPLTEYPKLFNVSSIPRTFLIDKSGHIVIDKTGAANWDSDKVKQTIENLLAN
ncbi:TlpA family protein disulfide reductase [Tamlana fucoidanivorans]|uniref:TlpA family protein disulfide reductase n=1 Tax=Allotamlana fucoidanivorans TaxID=2583814 RepID=A0A5C4SJL6_9FLAO|nr:TlpA disulfide reductase family protein [Tamlana fucoidanivorans]TNJ43166.1 TlpA family protein disulfide reductase [Tamlana fucoidanivorans]